MIRFCDKEVYCVMEDEIDRKQLLEYFMNGNRNELVCILNERNQFVGSITYNSLLGRNLEEAVIRDYLVLDADIWQNGRRYFGSYQRAFGRTEMVPVLNQEHQLLCFAWQDEEANRELRMLDELMGHKWVLEFRDVFPEYDCVIVNGCNELAWYFVRYLKEQNILIRTTGELWKELGIWETADALDYRCLTVYGEGIEKKDKRIEWRNSVSAEFECIDRIYEKNIREGIIRDAEGTAEDFCEKLKGKEIGILGAGEAAANGYDLLLGYEIDISCFVSEEQGMDTLFGKKVLTRIEAMDSLGEKAVFLDVGSRHSAWGFGDTDLYHYLGYKRNRNFFCLKDYMEISKNGFLNILKHFACCSSENLVLFGEPGLCLKLCWILEEQKIKEQIVYCDILHEYEKDEIKIKQIAPEEIHADSECFLLLPEYVECFINAPQKTGCREYLKSKYEEAFAKYQITKVVDYRIDQAAFMQQEQTPILKAGKILLGSINPYSGHIFFRGILECHPDILMMDYGYLSDNLFFICIRLALEKSTDILPVFWKLHDRTLEFCKKSWISNRRIFHQSMERMLAEKESFTSGELFVMLHIAYAEMKGKKVEDISEAVIFWEPHIFCDLVENYALWLQYACVSGYIVNVVRNACVRAGSLLRVLERGKELNALSGILCLPNAEKKEYPNFKRVVMRFEDIKLKPESELQFFCNETGIDWLDKMLETKASYGDVVGFDLRPVYRTYEEYFSSFDRFRISLITGPWQKKYGYPYVSSLDFERRELREMFSRKFRFEEQWQFQSEETETRFLKWRRNLVSDCLLTIRRFEVLGYE